MSDMRLRQRVQDLLLQLKTERKQELSRAVDFNNAGNQRKADYHTGLADGYLATINELRRWAAEFPAARVSTAVDEVVEL